MPFESSIPCQYAHFKLEEVTNRRAFINAGLVQLRTRCSTRIRILFPADVVRNCSKVEGRVISSTK